MELDGIDSILSISSSSFLYRREKEKGRLLCRTIEGTNIPCMTPPPLITIVFFFQEENLFSVAAIIFRRAMVTQECFFLIGFQLYCLLQVCLLHAELSMRMQMLLRSAIGGK